MTEPQFLLNSILVIEDDFDDIYFHRRIIEEVCAVKHIQVCRNVHSAMDYLQNQGEFAITTKVFPPPDLIFVDLNLPQANGWDFLDAYQALPDTITNYPLVTILTTSLNPEDERRALATGIVRKFFIKPLRSEELIRAMQRFFPDLSK